jgi:hypothetical protein
MLQICQQKKFFIPPNGKYLQPENPGASFYTECDEGDVLIATDESFLIAFK